MDQINALYGALHRSFAAVRRGDRIEADRWLGIAERIARMRNSISQMAQADAEAREAMRAVLSSQEEETGGV